MKYFITTLTFLVLTISSTVSFARSSHQSDAEAATAARADLERTLDMWRNGEYDDLYERTQRSGKTAKEDFASKLENATYKPACCWQKIQDVTVHIENATFAVVRAKIGLEGSGEVIYKTRSYKLVREGDVWRVSQTDLFSLAGAKKARKSSRKTH